MSYKKYPKICKSSWLCNVCKLESISRKKKRSSKTGAYDDTDVTIFRCSESEKMDKHGSIVELTDRDFNVIASSSGWLENTVVQEAQVCLKRMSPNIQGFQRPSLGAYLNFEQVTGDFIQILYTGGNHWVCVSSIGCQTGVLICLTVSFMMLFLLILSYSFKTLWQINCKTLQLFQYRNQKTGQSVVFLQLRLLHLLLVLWARIFACAFFRYPKDESTPMCLLEIKRTDTFSNNLNLMKYLLLF